MDAAAELKHKIAAAQEALAALENAAAAPPAPAAPDTSGMPGGVDSAPVNEPDPTPPGHITAVETRIEPDREPISGLAVVEGVDILHELKAGTAVDEIANRLLDSVHGQKVIVKAIGDIVKAIGI